MVRLICLAGHFYGLQSKISNEIYSEPLKHALSPREGPVKSFFDLFKVHWVCCEGSPLLVNKTTAAPSLDVIELIIWI